MQDSDSHFEQTVVLFPPDDERFCPDRYRRAVIGDLVSPAHPITLSRSFDILARVARDATEGEWYRDLARFSRKPPCHPPRAIAVFDYPQCFSKNNHK